MVPVEVGSKTGWAPEKMTQWIDIVPGILRLDGQGFRRDGRFERIVFYFATADEAKRFTTAMAKGFGVDAFFING